MPNETFADYNTRCLNDVISCPLPLRVMARQAYDAFSRDLRFALQPDGRSAENNIDIESFEHARLTIDDASSTFSVRVYNIDRVPFGVPARVGEGYTVIGGQTQKQRNSRLHADGSGGIISAPTQLEGVWQLCFKYSLTRAMWARFIWLLEVLARLSTLALFVAVVAAVLYYAPWRAMWQLATAVVAAVRQHTPETAATETSPRVSRVRVD